VRTTTGARGDFRVPGALGGYARSDMTELPPRDPCEPTGEPPGLELSAPAVVFLRGPAGEDEDRLAGAIVAVRPGALFVVSRSG